MFIFPADQPFMFGEVKYRNGGHFGPVAGSHLDLILLFNGHLVVDVDGEKRELGAGNAAVIYSEHIVDYMLFGNCHYTWCETGELVVSRAARESINRLPRSLPLWDRLDRLQKLGVQAGNGDGDNLSNLRNTLGAASFYEYFHRADLPEVVAALSSGVMKAKRFIERHYAEPCTLQDIARNAGLTPNYLVSSFRRQVGTTPTRYLWQVRTHQGMQLVTQTDVKIAQVAAQCGFQNQFHFSRHIKKLFGASPSHLRRRNWERQPSIVKGNPVDIEYPADGTDSLLDAVTAPKPTRAGIP